MNKMKNQIGVLIPLKYDVVQIVKKYKNYQRSIVVLQRTNFT